MCVNDCNCMMLDEYLKRDDQVIVSIGSTEQHCYLSLGTDVTAKRVSQFTGVNCNTPSRQGLRHGGESEICVPYGTPLGG
jgi:creatinine amidohydrolase